MGNPKEREKSIGINAVMSGLNTGLSLMFPLITFPYVSRVLGVENIGKYNFANSICSYGLLIASLGINLYAVREGTKYRDNEKKISDFATQIFSINLVLTVISYVILAGCLLFSAKLKEYGDCILIFSANILFTTIGVNWLYQIYEEYTYITIRNLVFKIVSLILMLLLVKKEEDYLIYAGITVFATVGSNIINFIHSRRYCNIRVSHKIKWRKHFVPLVVLAAANVATSLYHSADITMLGFWTNDYYVGIYSAVAKIYSLSKSIILAFLTVTVPRLSLYAGQNSKKEFEELIKKVIDVMNALMFPVMTGIFVMSDEIILLLGGREYLAGSITLKLLSAAIMFSMYAWISSECILIPFKREKVTMVSTVAGAALNIILNAILIPLYQSNAAAITTVLAELCVMIVCTYTAKTFVYFRYLNKNTISAIAGSLCVVLTCILVKKFVLVYTYRLALAVAASGAVYMIVLYIFKNEFVQSVFENVQVRLKKKIG